MSLTPRMSEGLVVLQGALSQCCSHISCWLRPQLPPPYAKLQLFADLSQYTRQQGCQLQTITKPLNNHRIPYQWGFPTKLLVTKYGSRNSIHTVEEGIQLLRTWGIIPELDPVTQSSHTAYPRVHNKGMHSNFNT